MEVQIDNSAWVAYVQYKTGGKTEIRPINKIRKKVIGTRKKQPINPKNVNDFEPRTYYSVKTAQDSSDGSETSWYALIGKITESSEEMDQYLAENKRFHWPSMDPTESEPATTENEVETPHSSSSVTAVRSTQLTKRKMVKSAKDATYEQLLQSHPLFDPEIAEKRPRLHESQPINNKDDRSSDVLLENKHLSALVEELHSKLTDKDEQLSSYKNVEENINNILKTFHETNEKSVQNIEAKIESKFSAFNELNDIRLTRLEDRINKLFDEKSSRASSSGFSESESSAGILQEDSKVHIGGPLFCSKFCYPTLTNPSSSHPDWFHALLLGCFGEKASLMRWRQSSETIKLTPEEKAVISTLYRQWLQSVKLRDRQNPGSLIRKHSDEQIEQLVRELPAYLGDRAYTIRKKTSAPRKRFSSAGAEKQTGDKRKYVKKGDIAPPSQQPALTLPQASPQQIQQFQPLPNCPRNMYSSSIIGPRPRTQARL